MTADLVRDRIHYARRRMKELSALNNGDLLSVASNERQLFLMEFFFHLVGAIDFLTQLVNEARNTGIDSERVDIPGVCKQLLPNDAIASKLRGLYKNPRKTLFPHKHPYTYAGEIYRIYNYRHQVSHRGLNPFCLEVGPGIRAIRLYLDPRKQAVGISKRTVQDDMESMLSLVENTCQDIIASL